MSFNTTSMPRLHNQTGVVMPDSGTVLDITALDKRIVKAQREIEYLSGAEAARGTHGGKRFRARVQSIESRREAAEFKLDQLEMAKNMLLRAQVVEPKLEPALTPFTAPTKEKTVTKIFGFLPMFWQTH